MACPCFPVGSEYYPHFTAQEAGQDLVVGGESALCRIEISPYFSLLVVSYYPETQNLEVPIGRSLTGPGAAHPDPVHCSSDPTLGSCSLPAHTPTPWP